MKRLYLLSLIFICGICLGQDADSVIVRQKAENVLDEWKNYQSSCRIRSEAVLRLITIVDNDLTFDNIPTQRLYEIRNVAMQDSDVTIDSLTTEYVNDVKAREDRLSKAINMFFVDCQTYPEVLANATFLAIRNEFTDLNDKIQVSLHKYNRAAIDYNQFIPTLIDISPVGLIKEEDYQY